MQGALEVALGLIALAAMLSQQPEHAADRPIGRCRAAGDEGTARLYEEVIQPEEERHHELAAEVLATHCTTPDRQQAAAAAMRNTLAIADELRTLAEKSTGLTNIPVS